MRVFTVDAQCQIDAGGGVTNVKAPLKSPGDILRASFQITKNVPKYRLKMLNGRKKGGSICKNLFR